MPRKSKKIIKRPRGARGFGLADTRPEGPKFPTMEELFAVVNLAMRPYAPGTDWLQLTADDVRHIRDLQNGKDRAEPDRSVPTGPSMALLQERIAVSIEQTKKQFDRLSQIGDRLCGPGTNPIGDGSAEKPIPGGAVAILNAQMSALDGLMARVDDQIARLETL